jgi:hypothetical protein
VYSPHGREGKDLTENVCYAQEGSEKGDSALGQCCNLKIMTNKVILDQNLNAGLKIIPQERQAAKFKLTMLRG